MNPIGSLNQHKPRNIPIEKMSIRKMEKILTKTSFSAACEIYNIEINPYIINGAKKAVLIAVFILFQFQSL